jgi:hypothetical protein
VAAANSHSPLAAFDNGTLSLLLPCAANPLFNHFISDSLPSLGYQCQREEECLGDHEQNGIERMGFLGKSLVVTCGMCH